MNMQVISFTGAVRLVEERRKWAADRLEALGDRLRRPASSSDWARLDERVKTIDEILALLGQVSPLLDAITALTDLYETLPPGHSERAGLDRAIDIMRFAYRQDPEGEL